MHSTDLDLHPNEASDLCPLAVPGLLEREGWDRAFVTVLDEATAEGSLAVLAHAAGAPPGDGWVALKVPATPTGGEGAGKTNDAEACAARDGWIYVLGSQFGKKAGPLQAGRSWIARVRAEDIEAAVDGKGDAPLEIARLRFGLHRAVNDALAEAGIELIERGPRTTAAYIDATIAKGADGAKRWAGRVQPSDHPLNVEAAEFRSNGALVLGIRYPVTAEGAPLLVEVDDVEALFSDPDAVPTCGAVWVLDGCGTAEQPAGVRALHTDGDDRFDVVIGDLDAAGKSATVLADHPEGGTAKSLHLKFELPPGARGGSVPCEAVHDFGELRRVEGIAAGPDGHTHYVVDLDGHVALRTLLQDEAVPVAGP